MPLLFYGRLGLEKRKLYSKDLKPIETEVFDSFKIKHLSPYYPEPALANLWWFEDRKHTAMSWNDSRIDITQPYGLVANQNIIDLKEQTIFIPGLIKHQEALAIARSEFPEYLVPGSLVFRFNNQEGVYFYD